MKLKNIFIVTTVVLVLIIGLLVAFVLSKTHLDNPAPSTTGAAPAVQSVSSPAINATLPSLNGAKDISEAKDVVESVIEGEIASDRSVSKAPLDQSTGYYYRSFVIKFKQDMDESTLNAQNIQGFIGNDPTEINCVYNAASKELQIDIKLDASRGDLNTVTIHVLLTKNIKTAGGNTIGSDYSLTVANNK